MNNFCDRESFARIATAVSWLFLLATPYQSGHTQTVSTNNGTASATVTYQAATAPAGLAVADEPYALYDGLIRALRDGGYALYVRHGAVLPGSVDKHTSGAWWRDCATTQRLAPEAQPRARAIGEALQRQRIAIYELLTSEYCRAYDTGIHIGLIPPARNPALNDPSALADPAERARYAAALQELLSRPPPAGVNRMLVGHVLPSALAHPALSILPEGHTAIFKPEGNNRFHHVATLSPGQWQWIGKQGVQTAAAPQVVVQPPAPSASPLIDPAKELKGVALVDALRQGGFNLFMRHAQATIGQDGNLLQTPSWWENCTIQRNMSDTGRDQARRVGAAIRALKIPVDQILTAQFCRTQETGHLLGLGAIEVTEDINHQIGQRAGFDVNAARFRRLAAQPAKGMNNVLVSHTHGSTRPEERVMSGMQEAEMVVYRPDGKGGSEPVARIPLTDWENLTRLMADRKS